MTTKLRAPTTTLRIKQLLYYQGCIFLEVQSVLRLMNCHPEHPSMYHGAFANIVYIIHKNDQKLEAKILS